MLAGEICGRRNLFEPTHSYALKRENHFPIILHADDNPAVLFRLVIERLGERADFRVGQSLSRAICILPVRISLGRHS